MVTILPIWHITERAAELCIFSRGVKLVYSNVRNLKSDLGEFISSHENNSLQSKISNLILPCCKKLFTNRYVFLHVVIPLLLLLFLHTSSF
jgi:hypothetical protein